MLSGFVFWGRLSKYFLYSVDVDSSLVDFSILRGVGEGGREVVVIVTQLPYVKYIDNRVYQNELIILETF